jgi:hypothetical protein
MVEAARTSETSVDIYFIRQYITEDNSELQNYELIIRCLFYCLMLIIYLTTHFLIT